MCYFYEKGNLKVIGIHSFHFCKNGTFWDAFILIKGTDLLDFL